MDPEFRIQNPEARRKECWSLNLNRCGGEETKETVTAGRMADCLEFRVHAALSLPLAHFKPAETGTPNPSAEGPSAHVNRLFEAKNLKPETRNPKLRR
jgi:hypothetical protein